MHSRPSLPLHPTQIAFACRGTMRRAVRAVPLLRPLLLWFGCAVLLAPSVRADATTTVRAALEDFLNQPSYTWSVANTRGMPEEMNGGGERDVGGQHEKGGYTRINFVSGPHIPPRGTRSSTPWAGITDEQGAVASRWLFETPQGWRWLRELPSPEPPTPASTARSTGIQILPPVKIRVSFSFSSLGIRRPDHEIALVLANLISAEDRGSGIFLIELSPEGALALVSSPYTSPAMMQWRLSNLEVIVHVRVRHGVLAGYSLAIQCDVIRGLSSTASRHIDCTITRHLTDFGTTVVAVPPEARERFEK